MKSEAEAEQIERARNVYNDPKTSPADKQHQHAHEQNNYH